MNFKEIRKATNLKELKLAMKGGTETPEETIAVDKNIVYNPTLPQVNVIPATVIEKYQFKGIARKFVLAGVGIVALFGLIYAGGVAFGAYTAAEVNKSSEEAASVRSEVEALAPYQAYATGIENKRTALYNNVKDDVNMGSLYVDVNRSSANNSVSLTSLAAKQNEPGLVDTSCINPDPFGSTEGIIGCLQFSGTAPNKDAVNGFLESLETTTPDNPSYKNPFISTFTSSADEGTQISNFTATIAFTDALYTNQYQDLSLALLEAISGTTSEEGAEETAEEPVEVQSPVATTVLQSIPEATTEDVQTIEGLAENICNATNSAEENSAAREASMAAMGNLISENYPEADVASVVNQIMVTVDIQCPPLEISTDDENVEETTPNNENNETPAVEEEQN